MTNPHSDYRDIPNTRERSLLIFIVIINLVIKLIPATVLELGNDEVYYWTYALFPDWSHFDHPPMVGLTIQLFTLNLHLSSELFIRAGALIFSSANIVILYYTVRKLFSVQAAFIAVLLFTSSFYFNIICGLFILPDTPMMLFVLLALYFGLPATISKNPSKKEGFDLLLFGLFTGLAFLSKYQSLFLWGGAGLYILFHNRVWLRKPYLYISVLITLILMIPVLYWNMNNNFISFNFHSQRVGLFQNPLNINSFIRFTLGQFFYQNPVLSVIFIISLVSITLKKRTRLSDTNLLLLYLAIPLILLFTFSSLFNDTLPHWTGPAFICLIIIASDWLKDMYKRNRKKAVSILLSANLLFLIVVVAGTIQINHGVFLPANKNSDPTKTGKNDFTLDMYGWEQAGKKFRLFLSKENISPADYNKIKIISNRWFPAAHLDYYIAYPLGIGLNVTGGLESAHKYYWINKKRVINPGDKVYYITPSQYYYPPEGLDFPHTEIIPKDTLRILRDNVLVKNLFIYEMR